MTPDLIDIEEGPDRIRLAWDNRRVRKDRRQLFFLVAFWIIWAPLTVFLTGKAAQEGGLLWLWCVFGWGGTILIPLSLLQTLARERVELSAEGLRWELRGCVPGARKHLPLSAISELWIGRIDKGPRNRECVLTLNVFERSRFRRRHLIGYWLHPDDKAFVFERLRRFAEARAWPVRFTDARITPSPRA